MVKQLGDRLDTLSPEEWREVLTLLRVEVIVFTDGTWEVLISAPAVSVGITTSPGCFDALPRPHIHSPKGP